MSWFQPLLDALKYLDKQVDEVAELFGWDEEENEALTAVATARQSAPLIDVEQLEKSARSTALALNNRYQQFMVQHFDPLFGQSRNTQLGELGGLDINPEEAALNRRIGYTAGALVSIIAGTLFFPASLVLTVPLSFALVVHVYGHAYRSVKQQRRVTHHVVSAINFTAIWLGGFYLPALAAMLVFFMGEKLLLVTEDRSKKGLISIFANQPRTVWLLRDGVEVEQPFEKVLPGDIIVVSAGGVMPVDGTVMVGLASIDQQMLTGEAQPVDKVPGDTVYAATVVLAGKLHVRVDKSGDQTVAAKIGEVLNQTSSYQLALQSRGSKLAHDLALPTLALSGLALVTLRPESALAILNSSFGVAVRISAPITMLNLLNIASHNAILLKDGRSLELLSTVDTVVFDKTGTLTLSQPNVVAIHGTGLLSEDQLLTFAAAAELRQSHPIALAIVAEAKARTLALPEIDRARYEMGYGIKVEISAQTIHVGSDRFMDLAEIPIPPAILEQRAVCHALGHSLVMVAVDGKLAGAIELQPTIRPEAQSVIQDLRKRGLQIVIISGDQAEPTQRLASKLGIDRYFANVLPEGKADLVERLQSEGRAVCFVGDGINDSIALKKANVSVSLRGATTVATDVAQVVLMQESLRQLPYLFELADTMDQSLKGEFAAALIPGGINVAGVFFLGWGFYQAITLNMASLIISLGIAMYPVYKHKNDGAKIEAPPSQATAVPVLVQDPQAA